MPSTLPRNHQRLLTFSAGLLATVLICGILYWARLVLVPLAVAFLLTFLLTPLVMRLDRLGLRRVPSVVLVVGTLFLFLAGLFYVIGSEIHLLAADLPAYQETLKEKIRYLREETEEGTLGKVKAALRDLAREIKAPPEAEKKVLEKKNLPTEPVPVRVVSEEKGDLPFQRLAEPILTLLPTIDLFAMVGLTLLLVLFMLAKREDLRNRLISFTTSTSVTLTTKAMDDAGQRISRFLFIQLIINSFFGMSIGVGLWLIGVPYPGLWGLFAGIMRYVPYIGAWIAAAFPLLLALITFPGWTQFIVALVLFAVLEFLCGNLLEPILYGHGTGVSEVALLIAAAFWTLIWGPIGLILATPLTVCLVVLGKHVPGLNFLDRLLGDEAVLPPHVGLVQRILARDTQEAKQIIASQCQAQALQPLYDDLFVPALNLVRRERLKNHMTAEEEALVLATIQESLLPCSEVAPPADPAKPLPAETPVTPPRLVFACPAHHEVDELSLRMLERFFEPHGFEVEVASTRLLPSEIIARIRGEQPELILIAALPPGGLPQAQFLCRKIRQKFPHLQILICIWGFGGNLDNVLMKFRQAGANFVTTSYQGALTHALAMVASPAPRRSAARIAVPQS